VAVMLVVTLLAVAKQKPTQYGRGSGKVYLFGVSQQLTDSVVYLTFINEVDSFDLAKKTKFLPFRSEFSLQLKEYMEGTLHKDHQTTVVFYSASRKKLSKKYYKIKKRYLDNPYTKIVPIDGFKFRHPLESFVNEKE
jgi:hypothetical protein